MAEVMARITSTSLRGYHHGQVAQYKQITSNNHGVVQLGWLCYDKDESVGVIYGVKTAFDLNSDLLGDSGLGTWM